MKDWKPIAYALMFVAGAVGQFMIVNHLEHKLDDQELAVTRRKTQCMSVRIGLETARRNLLTDDTTTGGAGMRAWGRSAFVEYMRGDWHLVNTCASETVYVGASCTTDDVPCMLHALDWALVNIR